MALERIRMIFPLSSTMLGANGATPSGINDVRTESGGASSARARASTTCQAIPDQSHLLNMFLAINVPLCLFIALHNLYEHPPAPARVFSHPTLQENHHRITETCFLNLAYLCVFPCPVPNRHFPRVWAPDTSE